MVKMIDQSMSTTIQKQNDLIAVLPKTAETTLESVLPVMQHITRWLIHSGVGYTDFIAALKPVFYQQALLELDDLSQKTTDSAISLLSGLHRKDVSQFKKHQLTALNEAVMTLPISVPARVIGRWIALDLPSDLPFTGEHNSFEMLVKEISTEKHPRSIVFELERLGVVKEIEGRVYLQQKSFTPDLHMQETKALFSANVADHIAAGIDNFIDREKRFTHLEQAVFADKLTAESVEKLRQLSVELWQEMAQKLVHQAIQYCEEDQSKENAQQRFRLGVYQYDGDMPKEVSSYSIEN